MNIIKDSNNSFDEFFLKLMNINDVINNVKEDINIIKSNIKIKKPVKKREPKRTLDLTNINPKKDINIDIDIDNKNNNNKIDDKLNHMINSLINQK